MRFTVKQNTPKTKADALAQLRQVRHQFETEHPELLERLKREIEKQSLYEATKVQEAQPDHEVIDKKKNILAVMKLLQSNNGSPAFQAALKKTLMGVLN
jgi:hypothetical protein